MSFPELVPGTGYRSFLDVVSGTLVTGVVENISNMIQTYLTNIELFAIFGFGKHANETIIRMLRILFEPPLLLGSIYLTQAAFTTDAGDATVLLPIIMNLNMSGYITQLALLKSQFIELVRTMEHSQTLVVDS